MITKKFGVKAAYITDYETLAKSFPELVWNIDANYLKFKKRGMPFLEAIDKNFHGLNDPSKHKHAVKNICSESVVLCNYIDRQYLSSILINVTETLTAYLTKH